MPLRFQSVFTKARTVKAVLVLFILAVSLRAPVISTFRIIRRTDPQTNLSSLYLSGQNRESINRFNDIMNRASLPWINYIIMVTCVCVIKLKLYQASQVRKTHTSYNKQAEKGQLKQERSSKDIRVIQSVVLICCIFIVSQLPFLAYTTGRLIDPAFDIGGRLQFLFFSFAPVSRTCSYLNASMNIFVYYNYNRKFKAVLLTLLKVK
ncbi:chemosensory receptor a [Plakobranchus ocellatus]|uniref:Chemosensory receptor a n=1 Tax=Plakobranchus ocellatus TaxID=259542 RepID=A0AAV4DZJ2_9GAST|nr:chemosensory receptor a [Plakobranchus ocellatus]